MQIASETKVYILDLIKLYDSDPDSLNQCLSRILHSSRILKLGKYKTLRRALQHNYSFILVQIFASSLVRIKPVNIPEFSCTTFPFYDLTRIYYHETVGLVLAYLYSLLYRTIVSDFI